MKLQFYVSTVGLCHNKRKRFSNAYFVSWVGISQIWINKTLLNHCLSITSQILIFWQHTVLATPIWKCISHLDCAVYLRRNIVQTYRTPVTLIMHNVNCQVQCLMLLNIFSFQKAFKILFSTVMNLNSSSKVHFGIELALGGCNFNKEVLFMCEISHQTN
jgi:hypothetical protein